MFKRYIDGYDKKVMKKKGVKYSKKFNKFILDGYGDYLKYIYHMDFDKYFNLLSKLGYEIVVGPVVYRNFVSSIGIYCKNYVDVYINKELLKDDLNALTKRIVTVSSLKNESSFDSYIEDLVIREIVFLIDVTANLDVNDFYKVIEDLQSIYNSNNRVNNNTLIEIIRTLTEYFYNRIVVDMNEDVDKERVNELVSEKITTNMIQKISPIFAVNPLISKGI